MDMPHHPLEFPEKLKHGDHLVQFYRDEMYLVDMVSNFIAPAIMNGEGAMIIATNAHITLFNKALKELHINTSLLQLSGQLLIYNADEVLSKVMVDDVPNAEKINQYIGSSLDLLRSKYSSVKVYGEMVNILWSEGNLYGTMAMEKIWSNLLNQANFTLLCSYGMDALSDERHGIAFEEICHCHSHVLPAEGVIESHSIENQLRNISKLQFKYSAKEKELKNWKMSCMEMMIPLTSIKIQLREIKANLNLENLIEDSELTKIISKCDNQLNRMRNIVEKLSQ